MQTQEQSGVWAMSPSRLAKTTVRMAARDGAGNGGVKTSRVLIKLFARLQAAAKHGGDGGGGGGSGGEALDWVRSVLPKRVFHVFRTYARVSKSTLAKIQQPENEAGRDSPAGSFRQDAPGARVTVYRFPLDAESHDMEDGTMVYEGWTGKDGRVMCRVSPGCYTIEVKTLPGKMGSVNTSGGGGSGARRSSRIGSNGPVLGGETKKRLIMIDPARGHMDKPVVVIPIELSAPG